MTTIPLKKHIEVELHVPDYLHTVATQHEDSRLIGVEELSNAELRMLIKNWGQELLKNAKNKRMKVKV